MKRYTKVINDKTVTKLANRIVVIKDGMQIFNPTEEMILEDGWTEYVYVEPEMTLKDKKEEKKREVLNYDSSKEINEFTIQEISVWLDKATRAGLMLRFQSEIAFGRTETTLWYEGLEFNLTLEQAQQILYALEVYASECYDNTQRHLSNIDKLESMTEVDEYDFHNGYPEKLRF